MHRERILYLLLWLLFSVYAEPQETPMASHTSERPILENPAYDPTIYHKFVPQDAVQQYVHSYTGHNYPMSNNPAYGPPSSSSFEPTAYAAIPSKGFEGYLIPAATAALAPAERTTLFGSFRSLIPSARSVASFIGQLLSLVLGSAGAVALGTLMTATLCFFTPFCTLSFRSGRGLAIAETAQDVVSAISEQVTADRVKRAAEFVQGAIDKFQRLNQAVKRATEIKAAMGFDQPSQ
ncbi:uncharacterized protein LOC129718049 [Wyeomyia smithii]|uniref:uncharacterized protein LOC129718049 n=1 Tax=Wyeomyia smithii TaxID=174621 RepID=UPI0024680A58|nr:uncharacterized protein LOC129718049 [Wyeomyia smithii]